MYRDPRVPNACTALSAVTNVKVRMGQIPSFGTDGRMDLPTSVPTYRRTHSINRVDYSPRWSAELCSEAYALRKPRQRYTRRKVLRQEAAVRRAGFLCELGREVGGRIIPICRRRSSS